LVWGFEDSLGCEILGFRSVGFGGEFGAMTAAERVEECESEGEEVPVPEPPQAGEECAAEQEEPKQEPASVTVDSVITVDSVVEQDGKVEETYHEEVNFKQTFTAEEPMPYGPDESLTQEGKVRFLA